jgi:cation diffusion facilitator CzcD-associated flavoprotein CzcO
VVQLETDYLVVGAGATGMAFVDTLVAESDADVVMVDRRHRPGGHWLDAYPFVRLHQPSANYGVTSRDGHLQLAPRYWRRSRPPSLDPTA